MCREIVLNMFKNFMPFFFAKIFANPLQECLATVILQLYNVHASVMNLWLPNFGEFAMRQFRQTRTNVVVVMRKHANNSQLSGEKIKLSGICMSVVRHSHECLMTVTRVSHICHLCVSRLSHDSHDLYLQNWTEIHKIVA